MTYAISDIHGCYDKYMNMLEKIDLKSDDTLYVLGDIIDRGADGFKIMLDAASRPNVHTIMGNHEAMAINALNKTIQASSAGAQDVNDPAGKKELELWFRNGGAVSLAQLLALDPAEVKKALEYMLNMPLYKDISVGEKEYVLIHGGLENFSASKKLSDYEIDEIVWARPEANTRYYSDKTVVVRHTPTFLYDGRKRNEAKMLKTDTFVDIDCGCVYGGRLACLCLDTNEEYYV